MGEATISMQKYDSNNLSFEECRFILGAIITLDETCMGDADFRTLIRPLVRHGWELAPFKPAL